MYVKYNDGTYIVAPGKKGAVGFKKRKEAESIIKNSPRREHLEIVEIFLNGTIIKEKNRQIFDDKSSDLAKETLNTN